MPKYAIVKFIDEESPLWVPFSDEYIAASRMTKAPNTLRHMILPVMKNFTKFIGNPKISDITTHQVERWVQTLARYSANSIHVKIEALHAAFNYGIRMKFISDNPVAGIKKPRNTFAGRVLADWEIVKILALLKPRYARIVKFALYTGMRRGEICRMDYSWVVGGDIVIPFKYSKSRKERRILISPAALALIGEGAGLVFPADQRWLSTLVASAARRAGLGRVRFHDLRHSVAARLFGSSVDRSAIMDQMGWANEASAKPYDKITPERKGVMLSLSYRI